MKILFLCHKTPYPPNKGEKLRAFNIIKHLSADNDICLVAPYSDKKEILHTEELKKLCKGGVHLFFLNTLFSRIKSMFSIFQNKPATLFYFYLPKMKAKINKLINEQKFDLVFVYSSSMAQYVMDVDMKRIIDFVDCDSSKWKQYSQFTNFPVSLIYAREYKLLKEYEEEISGRFDHAIVVTEEEKKEFTHRNIFTVMPNGVDLEYFKPSIQKHKKRVVFTGAMDYFANIDGVIYFSREIFPLIKKDISDVEFYIVGSRPTQVVKALEKEKGIFVTGFVEDIREYMTTAAVCVVPLRIARGIQNKILEAMACGLPVVTTRKALSGINASSGNDILVSDHPEDFAKKIVMLLNNDSERAKIGANARKYVEKNHNWQNCLAGIEELLIL